MKIIIYSETNAATIHANIGKPEYSYYYVLKSFVPLLERLGEVVTVTHPELEVDEIFNYWRLCNETCIFLSFSPPHRTLSTLQCPTFSVFAWEFDDFPSEKWAVEQSADWRHTLSRISGVIVHSSCTASLVKKLMGVDYPVVSIPSPLWSDQTSCHRKEVPKLKANLKFAGWLFDSRNQLTEEFEEQLIWNRKSDEVMLSSTEHVTEIQHVKQGLPVVRAGNPVSIVLHHMQSCLSDLIGWISPSTLQVITKPPQTTKTCLSEYFSEDASGALESQRHEIVLDGVVYTTVLNPSDGRKNLAMLIREFCDVFSDELQATLVIKSNHFKSDYGVAKVVAELLRQQDFLCRVVVISGYLDDKSYRNLLHATTYALNTSYGEGQCLPLMEYMAQGIPAVSPDHTALADYISEDNSFVISHYKEPACWPHDPRQVLRTYKSQIKNTSLRSCYQTSFAVARNDAQYVRMSKAAAKAMQTYCSIDLMEVRLREFLTSDLVKKRISEDQSRKSMFGTLSLDAIDSRKVGLSDAVMSGWFLRDTFEITRGVSITKNDVVLDVGCGAGGATKFCADAGAHVIFSDVDAEKINQIRRELVAKGHKKFDDIVCDSMPLPVSDGRVTKVLAMEMLEHVDNPASVMQELVRVGARGCQYVLTVPDQIAEQVALKIAPAKYFETPNHIRIFSRQEFTDLVEEAGLIVEDYRQDGFYWAMWMSLYWVSQRAEGNNLAGAALDMVAPPYNQLLECWAKTWGTLLETPGGETLKKALDDIFPKRQTIIARKL